MARTYRVTVLRCDFVPEPDRTRHGDAHERMLAHLQRAGEAAGLDLALDWIDVYGGELPADDPGVDLYVTTGSATDPDSEEPWVVAFRDWLRWALGRGKRVYGVCFGHQLIAHALGGQTRRHPIGWEVGSVGMTQLFPLSVDDVRCAVESFTPVRLLMSHQDEVSELPDGARPWLRGDFCEHQGFVIPGSAVTVQGHPEFAVDQVSDLYERRRQVMGDQLTDAAQRSLRHAHDGLALTVQALRYLLPEAS